MNESKYSFLSQLTPLQKAIALVCTTIVGLSGLVSAVGVIKGNFSLTLAIAVTITVIGLYTTFFYIKFAKTENRSELIEPGKSLGKRYIFDAQKRQLSNWGVALLSVTALVAGGSYIYSISPSNQVIILVADFEDPGQPAQKNYKVTAEIVEKLQEKTKNFPNIKIKTLNEHLSFRNTKDEIKAKGTEQHAAIIIWGDLGKTEQSGRLEVNVEILKKPSKIALVNNKIISRIPVNELETYKAQINLSNQLSFFVLVVDGLAQTEAENYDAAIDRFTTALNEPDLSNEFVNLSDVYYFRGSLFALKSVYLLSNQIPSAITDLNQALIIKDDFGKAHALRGFCYLQNGQHSLALKDFNRATEIDPDSATNHFFQGLAYYLRYKYNLAEESLKRVSEVEPQEASDFLLRGSAYMFLGEGNNAIKNFITATDRDASLNNDVLLMIALTKASQNNTDEALNLLNQLIKNKPDLILAKVMRAMILLTKDKQEEAITEINSAIKSAPSVDKLYLIRGQIFLSKERYEDALNDFDKAISLNHQSSENLFNRAQFYVEKKMWREAIIDFDKIIELDPEVAEYYLERGKALREVNNFSEAASDFIKAINLYPQYKDAYVVLSKIYAAEHRFGIGEITTSQIQSIYPANPVEKKLLIAFSYQSRCEFHKGERNFDLALADCTEAVELMPDFIEAYSTRAEVYTEQSELFNNKYNEKEPEFKLLESEITRKEGEIVEIGESVKLLEQQLKSEKSSRNLFTMKVLDLMKEDKIDSNSNKENIARISEDVSKATKEANNHYEKIVQLSNETRTKVKDATELNKNLISFLKKSTKLRQEGNLLLEKMIQLKKLASEDTAKSTKLLQQEVDKLELETKISIMSRLPSLPIENDK